MPRKSRDLVATVSSVIVIVGILCWLSPDVRERVFRFASHSQEWVAAGNNVGSSVVTTGTFVNTYASENTYLFIMVVGAVVLLGLMLRT